MGEGENSSSTLNTNQMIPATTIGVGDKISFTGLTNGDVVKVYDAATAGNLISGNLSTITGGAADFTFSSDLGAAAKNVWVTVTSTGKAESSRVQVAMPLQTSHIDLFDTLPELLLQAYDDASLPIRHKTASGLGLTSNLGSNTITLTGNTTVAQLESTDSGQAEDDGYLLYAINSPSELTNVTKIRVQSGTIYPLANFSPEDNRLNNGYLLNAKIYDADSDSFITNTLTLEWLDASNNVVATSTYTINASGVTIQ